MASKSLGFSIWARDTTAGTFTKLAQTVDRLQGKLKELDRTKADPEVTVQTARAQRDLDRFVATMRTKLAAAVRSLPEIELDANSSDVDRELVAIRAKLAALRANIEIDADPQAALAEIGALSTRLRALGAQSTDVTVRADIAGALRGLGAVEAEARRLDGRSVRVKADVDGAPGAVAKLGALGKAADSTGGSFFASANSFLHFAKTMGLVTAVVGLAGPVLGAVGTAVAALPAFLFSVIGPAAAVAVGLDGIQAAAQRLMPAFGQMKLAVSATFEQGLTPVLQSLLPLFPMVTAGLQSMASGLTNVARQTVAMVTSAAGVQQIGQIFAGVRVLIDGMAPAMAVFTQNLLTMAAVGIAEFSRLGQVFNTAAVGFRTMLNTLIGSGEFQAAVRGFVDIVGALLGALNQVIMVAIQLGAQLSAPIVTALQAVGNAIVALAPLMGLFGGAFLAVITLFANAITALAPVITPIIGVILNLAMTILNALMPPLVAFVNQILSAALPVLIQLAGVIGSVLATAINALAPLFPVLVSAVQQLLAAISPLIPQIGALVTQLIVGLAPILPQLVGLFFSLLMAITPLLPPIIQLATMFVPILIAVVQALMPVVTAVANAFLQVLAALMPMIPPLMQLVQALLPPLLAVTQAVLPVVVALANAFMQVVMALLPLLPPIIQLALAILPPLAASLARAAQIAAGILVPAIQILGTVLSFLITVLVTVIGGIINFVTTAIGWFTTFSTTFGGIWNAVLAVFSFVWNAIVVTATVAWNVISAFFSTAFAVFQAAWGAVWLAVQTLFGIAWGFIRDTAMTIWNVMSAFWGAAFATIQALWSTVWNGISALFAVVWNTIRNIAITVWNAIVAFLTPALNAFQMVFSAIWTAISIVFQTVWNFIRNTAVTIWNAISAFFTTALTVFTTFWSSIWNNIVAFFSDIWNRIWAFVQHYWALIKHYWDVALNAFKTFWGGIWNNIVTFFSDIWNRIWAWVNHYWSLIRHYYDVALAVFKNLWTGVWNDIVATFDRIWSGIVDIATRVWESVRGAFVTGVNIIIDLINGFAGAINAVADLLGFNINLHIDRLAVGGEVEATRRALGGDIVARQVIRRATGGGVDATGGGRLPNTGTRRDTLPALARGSHYALQGKEWIVRRGASQALGADRMNAINNADRNPIDVIPRGMSRARYADGGPLDPIRMATSGEIAAKVSRAVPGSSMSSGYRPGDPGFHGRNMAADMVGNLKAINWYWAQNYGNTTDELIYTPGINLDNGRPHTFSPAVQADHHDHVHIAYSGPIGAPTGAAGSGPGIGDFFQALIRPVVEGLLNPLRNRLIPVRDNPTEGFGNRMTAGTGVKLVDFLIGVAAQRDAAASAMGPAGPGSGPVVDQVRAVANRFGWGAGAQWDALSRLIQKESSWNPNAQNPTSTAYGLFQFLNGTWGTVGGRKTSNPGEQAEYGLRYIRQRYRDPIGALGFHNRNNWYDQGGWLEPGLNLAYNGTGHREPVLPFSPHEWRDMVRGTSGGRAGTGDEFDRLAKTIARELRGDRSLIGSLSIQAPHGASASDVAHVVSRELRLARIGGVHR